MTTSDLLSRFLDDNVEITALECMLVDPNGIIRGKWAPVSTLKKAFSQGMNFPLSLHGCDVWGREVIATGLHIESGDQDGFCCAVPQTLARVPWGARPTAQVLLETFNPDGTRFFGCSRGVLANVVKRAADAGIVPVVAFELEFFLLKPEDQWRSDQPEIIGAVDGPDMQRMYSLDALAEHSAFFEDVRHAAELQSLSVDTIVKEAAPGQFEINLNHRDDAMGAADDVVLLRRIISECARKNNLLATFMAKPFIGQPGNGMHVHASLLDNSGVNIFAGQGGRPRLESAVAGLLETMAEMSLVFVGSYNGFRRMQPGSYAPTRANWGENNRSVALRIPASGEKARRVEHRISGADANPYLVLAAILQAMLDGMAHGKRPPEAESGNSYDRKGKELPTSLSAALELLKDSKFAAHALGTDMVKILVALKHAELAEFEQEISPLERSTFL